MNKDSLPGRIWNWLFGHDRSIGFGLEYLGHLTLRWPLVVGIFVMVMSVFCAVQIPRASVDGDLLRVFAHSGEEYDAYDRLADTFGTFENDIYLLVRSPDLANPQTIETIREMALDLSNSEYISGTMSAFTLRVPTADGTTLPAVPEGMQTPEEVRAALTNLQQTDPMMRNLINPDLSGVVIIVFPNPEMTRGKGTKAMIADLRALVADYQSDQVQVELTGPPIWTGEMLSAAVDDQIKFTIYGFTLGALIALFSLRSFWGAILVAATPFVAVMWVMGTIIALFGSFSFLTIIVTTIILVIAFAESLFFIFNWLAYWREGMDPYKAVDETVRVVGPASALTMLTTLISFASLSLTAGQGIQEFSYAGTIASLTNFICLMTFLPLLLKLAVRLGFKAPKPSFAITAPIPVAWWVAKRFGRPLAVLAIVTTGLLLIPYGLIQPHFSFEDFMAKGSTALTAAEQIDQGVGGVAPLYVNVPLDEGIADVGDKDFEKVKKVHEIVEKYLGKNKVISAAAFTHYAESGFTREQIFNAVGDLKRRFVTDDGSRALVTGFMPTIIDSEELVRLKEGIEADVKAAGIDGIEVGGFRVMTTYATDNIVRGLQLDLTISVIVNLFLIGWAFRSLRVAVATAIPNLFPILGTEAWLWWSGAGLQLTTVLSLTIAFGIAVDDTTHFLSHYLHARREEGRNHLDAIHHTMERIGGAIIAATLILCSGTAIVMFSELPQVALFGTLFVITLGFALIGDVFILPALLVAGGRFFHPLGGVKK
ncbi:MMPL family transporter [Devosia sp.]|uniref:efflux RND transporter permease subunit n=1 Tax=Devosia sp. TaxID=1871048 RepID=UPI001AD4ED34|nr:MMPL family transporter [Devosia sp.]MBN9309714.1 MMPL family transporter [Devosia sp.]